MRHILSTLAVAAVLAASAPALADTLFFDDFNGGASAAWGNQSGGWRAVDGTYDATLPSNAPATYTDVTTLNGLTDFNLDVDVKGFNDGGIWLRSSYNTQTNQAAGILLVTGGNLGTGQGFYWHEVTGGVYGPVLGAVSFAGLQGSDQHLHIEVRGPVYSLYIGGNLITSISSGAFADGSAGLYDFSPVSGASNPRGQTFDNFLITDVNGPTAPVPEPGEWAMIAGGLGVVGAIARRRQRKG